VRRAEGSDGDDDTPSSDVDEDVGMEEEDEDNPASGELDCPEVELEDSSEEEDNETTEEAKDVDMNEQEAEEEAVVAKHDDNPASNEAAAAEGQPDVEDTWACSSCTFLNSMNFKKCDMCKTPASKSKRRRRS